MSFKRLLSLVLLIAGISSYSNAQFINGENTIFSAGVSYGGGLGAPGISYNLLPGYSGTVSPGFMLSVEHTFSKTFGMGGAIYHSGASMTANDVPYPADPINNQPAGLFTDNIKGSYTGISGRVTYHFKGTYKFDPYAGALVGFTITSISSTVTDGQGKSYATHSVNPGILAGIYLGGRYYFTDQFGMWLEIGYTGMPDYLANLGFAYKLSRW